jgi:hypothetical protein
MMTVGGAMWDLSGSSGMSEYLKRSLPNVLADDLIDAKLAVRPTTTRGPGLGEVFSVTVDCINTGSAVVSIGVAVATLRRLARAIIKHHNPADPDIVTISVDAGGVNKVLAIDRSMPTAESELLDFLIAALASGHADIRK